MKSNCTKNILSSMYTVALVAFILFGVQQVYAWTGNSSVPPAGNVAHPITASSATQTKVGALGLGGLAVYGDSVFLGGLRIATGAPSPGKVLTADALGNVSWMSLPPSTCPAPTPAPVVTPTPVVPTPRYCPPNAVAQTSGSSNVTSCTIYTQVPATYYCEAQYQAGYGDMATGSLFGNECAIGYVSPPRQRTQWGPYVYGLNTFHHMYPATVATYTNVPSCPAGWTLLGTVCI